MTRARRSVLPEHIEGYIGVDIGEHIEAVEVVWLWLGEAALE